MDLTVILLRLFNVSVSASFLALAVILFRFIFKKAPKWLVVALWALVAVRLVFPFSLESSLSLLPANETIPEQILTVDPSVQYDASFGLVENPTYSEFLNSTVVVDDVFSFQRDFRFASYIWLGGVALLMLYAFISYLRLKFKVRTAMIFKDNVWVCDEVKSPFILGVLRPRIYLPSDIDEDTADLVLSHEKAHLKRRDHLWKPLGFVILSFYWFNPVMWLSYALLCCDIELACDEKVIRDMENAEKKVYSEALLNCSVSHRMISACPVAFGEVGVKKRIKSVLDYKKPAFRLILVSVVVSLVIALCFMTGPKKDNTNSDYITGINSINEFSFPMEKVMSTATAFRIIEGSAEEYFNVSIEEGFIYNRVNSLLNELELIPLSDGTKNPKHETVHDKAIYITSDANYTVRLYFYNDYQNMYMIRIGNTFEYSVESKTYSVLNAETVKEFFEPEIYKNEFLIWEYNPSSSARGHGEISFYIDEKFEFDGEIVADGVVSNITDEEKGLKGISWRPDVLATQDSYEVFIPVTYEGKSTAFHFAITKTGKRNLSTYFKIVSKSDMVVSGWGNGYEYLLSLPEDETNMIWYYNPTLSAVGYGRVKFILPDGYTMSSRDVLQDGFNKFYHYNADAEMTEFDWSPDDDSLPVGDAVIAISAVKGAERAKFTLTLTPVSNTDDGGVYYKIECEGCDIIQRAWATYQLKSQ